MATSPATDLRSTPAMPVDGLLLAEELLDLAERAQAYTNAAGVAIALKRGNDLLVRTSTGSAPEVGAAISADDAFIAECLNRRKPLCCRDTESDARVGAMFRAAKTRSLIAIPICGHVQARGVMIVIAPLPNAFQPTHTAILMTLSDIVGSKLAAREAPELSADLADFPPSVSAVPEPKPAPKPQPIASPAARVVFPAAVAAEPLPVASPVPAVKAVAPSVPAAAPVPAAPAVPPALLKDEPLRLVEEKKAGPDPALLNPAEDPLRFKREKTAVVENAAPAVRPKPVKTVVKPVATAVAPRVPTPIAAPAAPKAAPVSLPKAPVQVTPAAVAPIAVATPLPATKVADVAAPVRVAFEPALTTWEKHAEPTPARRFVVPAIGLAAALAIAAGMWLYRAANAPTATPAIPAPAAAAFVQPPASPVETPAPPVARSAPAIQIERPAPRQVAEDRAEHKPVKAAEERPEPPAPPVMKIAAAQPKPKPEPQPEIAAPKLALAGNDAAVASLSKVGVAVPLPPKSELVPATLVSRVTPQYPSMAKQLGVYGKVVMNVTIGANGSVTSVHVTSGAVQLRQAAVDAVRQWRYKPAMLDGKPAESSAEVQVNFAR